MTITDIEALKTEAKFLIGKPTESSEYIRGICELLATFDYVEDMPQAERSQEICKELFNI